MERGLIGSLTTQNPFHALLQGKCYRLLLFSGFLTLLCPVQASVAPITKENLGVIFQPMKSFPIASSNWKSVLHVQIPTGEMNTLFTAPDGCDERASNRGVKDKSHCDLILQTLKDAHLMKEDMDKRFSDLKHLLLSLSKDERRQRRDIPEVQQQQAISALVDKLHTAAVDTVLLFQKVPDMNTSGMGAKRRKRNILTWITSKVFGVAQQSDVDELHSFSEQCTTNFLALTERFQQFQNTTVSLNKLTNSRVDNVLELLKNSSRLYSERISDLTMDMYSITQTVFEHSTLTSRILRNLMQAEADLSQLASGINSLVQGRLSPLLVPEHDIVHVLESVDNILMHKFPGFKIIHKDPAFYYINARPVYWRSAFDIFIAFLVPVSPWKDNFLIYEIIPFPLPVTNQTNVVTELETKSKYLAITEDKSHYSLLTDHQFTACSSHTDAACTKGLIVSDSYYSTCVLAIFLDDYKTARRLCTYVVRKADQTSYLINLGEGQVILVNSPGYYFDCDDGATSFHEGCTLCQVTLPCLCSIISGHQSVARKLDTCTPQTKPLQVRHAVNLPLAWSTLEADAINSLQDAPTFENFDTIPELRTDLLDIEKVAESHDLAIRSDIKTLLRSDTENNAEFERSLYSVADSWDVKHIKHFFTLSNTLVLIALAAVAIVVILIIVKGRSMSFGRITAALMGTLGQAQHAQALTRQQPPCPDYHDYISDVIIIMALLLIGFLYLLHRTCAKQPRSTSDLEIELRSAEDSITLGIRRIIGSPAVQHIKANLETRRMNLYPGVKPLLTLPWSHWTTSDISTDTYYPLPSSIHINPLKYFRLKAILNASHMAHLKFTHNKAVTYVPKICASNCPGPCGIPDISQSCILVTQDLPPSENPTEIEYMLPVSTV